MSVESLKKGLLIVAGSICVALGFLGVFLPLLPTTPFLLLAAACYAASSERLYAWLLANPTFGPLIRDWREHRALPLRVKVVAVGMIWVMIGSSVLFVVPILWVKILLLVVAASVSAFLLSIKTKPAQPQPDTAAEPAGNDE